MARIVLGMGTSHSPMASSPHELWDQHARGFDMRNNELMGKDGKLYDYRGLLATALDSIRTLSDEKHFPERFERCQVAITDLARRFAEAKPDVAIIVGEDQHEQIHDDNMPSLMVYWGDTVENKPRRYPADAPDSIRAASWAFGTADFVYPVASDLGLHIINQLREDDFDVAHSRRLPVDQGIGHAFAFVYHRIMGGNVIPHVPVMLNTYYPPNQILPRRAYDVGKALRRAIDSWDASLRVAVIASGGLSHFVVNEELDRMVLRAMEQHDEQTLRNLPRIQMHSGTSEILNWLAVAGAVSDMDMKVVDYVPCYRSEAGTGIGMSFAVWQ